MTRLVIGAPAWDRSWSLPLWFASVRDNVEPADTGLVFVVPASDTSTREDIASLSTGFRWVEVLRDRGTPFGRTDRPKTDHQTLATARNQILQVVERVKPCHYLSWDTDFLVPRGTFEMLVDQSLPLVGVWAWLNRQPPHAMRYFTDGVFHDVLWEDPVRATGMHWDSRRLGRALHYPAHEYGLRSHGTWRCDVVLAWQLMTPTVYRRAHYSPHRDGEDIPFHALLEQQGIPRFCCGDIRGVHLYDRLAEDERLAGWPRVMDLAKQRPLATDWTESRSPEFQALGFFPRKDMSDEHTDAAA